MKKILLGIGYWVLQLTWGILMNAVGLLVFLFCLIFCKPKICGNGFGIVSEVGGDWGGLSLGAFAFCGRYSQEGGPCYYPNWYHHTRKHEFGHSLQNMVLGPFFFFVVGVPSVIRYWYYVSTTKKGKKFPVNWYDSIWFEGQATNIGHRVVDYIEGGEK